MSLKEPWLAMNLSRMILRLAAWLFEIQDSMSVPRLQSLLRLSRLTTSTYSSALRVLRVSTISAIRLGSCSIVASPTFPKRNSWGWNWAWIA